MHPYIHARETPDKLAVIMAGSGEKLTYRELEDRSNKCAQLYRKLGLKRGDAFAVFMDNRIEYFEICWGGQRSGLYYTCISSRLTAGEVEYIVRDCGAKLLIVSHALEPVARELPALLTGVKLLMVGGTAPGFESFEAAVAPMPAQRIADESTGTDMLYSSGTTGRPKGVRMVLPEYPIDERQPFNDTLDGYGFKQGTIYISPAPLYHAAPLRYCMWTHRYAGTAVVLEHYDSEACLATIEKYKCDSGQFVPTMFVRMLKLPEEARKKYDVSSMKLAIHAAAPCPIEVKRKMIEWWGPVLTEYYAGTEGNGFTWLTSEEWLKHPGSVGHTTSSILHICNDEGEELPVGEEGTVYFEGPNSVLFSYHNDPKKTAESRHPRHDTWSTLGDVGRVDADGYLYLTDRKAFMIISGGVNIYPQETENLLINHPAVADVAVIGVPNEEFGEEVKAVVQPQNWSDAGPKLAEELIRYCRDQLSPIKCPRSVDFEKELPRHPTGKLYKRLVRDRYWGKRDSRIV